jgi:hypothetical protein
MFSDTFSKYGDVTGGSEESDYYLRHMGKVATAGLGDLSQPTDSYTFRGETKTVEPYSDTYTRGNVTKQLPEISMPGSQYASEYPTPNPNIPAEELKRLHPDRFSENFPLNRGYTELKGITGADTAFMPSGTLAETTAMIESAKLNAAAQEDWNKRRAEQEAKARGEYDAYSARKDREDRLTKNKEFTDAMRLGTESKLAPDKTYDPKTGLVGTPGIDTKYVSYTDLRETPDKITPELTGNIPGLRRGDAGLYPKDSEQLYMAMQNADKVAEMVRDPLAAYMKYGPAFGSDIQSLIETQDKVNTVLGYTKDQLNVTGAEDAYQRHFGGPKRVKDLQNMAERLGVYMKSGTMTNAMEADISDMNRVIPEYRLAENENFKKKYGFDTVTANAMDYQFPSLYAEYKKAVDTDNTAQAIQLKNHLKEMYGEFVSSGGEEKIQEYKKKFTVSDDTSIEQLDAMIASTQKKSLRSLNTTRSQYLEDLERELRQKKIEKVLDLLGNKSFGQSVANRSELEKMNKADLDAFRSAAITTRAGSSSLPVKHGGGRIGQTGPIFAQKGEFILPAGYQDGGEVAKMATGSLTTGTIKVEDGGIADKIYDKIKDAISSSEIKVDSEARVKVDVADSKVPVDLTNAFVRVEVGDAKVPVDVSDAVVTIDVSSAAGTLSDTIRSALASASVKIDSSGAGAVGADKLDSLAQAIDNVQNKVFLVKDDLENLNTKMLDLEGKSITVSNVRAQVDSIVRDAIAVVEADVQENRQDISLLSSTVRRLEIKNEAQFSDIQRTSNQARDLTGRSII